MTFSSSKTLSAFVSSDDGRPLIFEQLPFDHPLYILYSSGTTGPPKCIVHSGGVCGCHANIKLSLSHTTSRACSFKRRRNSWHISTLEYTTHISNLQRYMSSSSLSRIKPYCENQTAWMMWPYMLAGLACGSRMILYEGSPFYPDVREYLKFINEQKYSPVPI